MQFGFCYIPDYYPDLHGDFSQYYERLLSEWELADQLGYDAIWLAEHRYPGYAFSSLPVVAQALADRTERIRVGTAVALLPSRHPVLSAEHWAAVDLLSGGRLNFGIGRGISAYDFDTVGVPSEQSRERFEEAWEVIRRLWTEDGVVHEGKYWSFEAHSIRPRPLQQPMPPIYVAAVATPETYRWAGRNGYHLMLAPFLLDSTERQRSYVELYHEELMKAGHDPSEFEVLGIYHLSIVAHEDQLEGADEHFYRYLKYIRGVGQDAWAHALRLRGSDASSRGLTGEANRYYQPGEGMAADIEEMRAQRTVIGTPEQCVERMAELAAGCGLNGWMFELSYGGVPYERVTEQLHLFAEEVIPQLRT